MRKDKELEELTERMEALRARAASLVPSEEADHALIEAIDRCEASPADLRRLARRLRPFVRAQILRGGMWRTMLDVDVGKLSFSPAWAIEAAVEVCMYAADEEVTDERRLVGMLEQEPNFDFERLNKRYRGGGMAVVSWKCEVELLLVREAIGEPTCHALRMILDEAAEVGALPEEAHVYATDRELRLVEPLWYAARHYPIVSGLDGFPF